MIASTHTHTKINLKNGSSTLIGAYSCLQADKYLEKGMKN